MKDPTSLQVEAELMNSVDLRARQVPGQLLDRILFLRMVGLVHDLCRLHQLPRINRLSIHPWCFRSQYQSLYDVDCLAMVDEARAASPKQVSYQP